MGNQKKTQYQNTYYKRKKKELSTLIRGIRKNKNPERERERESTHSFVGGKIWTE